MLTVVVICEELSRGLGLYRKLAGTSGLELRVTVVKQRGPVPRRLAALAWNVLRLNRADRRLAAALRRRGSLHLTARALHHSRTLAWVRRQSPDVGLHATSGVIYRKELIDCFRLGILNPHIGLLPEYRGRSVMEWSLLHGDPTGATTFFIDEGIDTGAELVLRRVVDLTGFESIEKAKDHLYSLEGEMFAEALRLLQRSDYRASYQAPEEGRRYYVMSELFRGVVSRLLAAGVEYSGAERQVAEGERS